MQSELVVTLEGATATTGETSDFKTADVVATNMIQLV